MAEMFVECSQYDFEVFLTLLLSPMNNRKPSEVKCILKALENGICSYTSLLLLGWMVVPGLVRICFSSSSHHASLALFNLVFIIQAHHMLKCIFSFWSIIIAIPYQNCQLPENLTSHSYLNYEIQINSCCPEVKFLIPLAKYISCIFV